MLSPHWFLAILSYVRIGRCHCFGLTLWQWTTKRSTWAYRKRKISQFYNRTYLFSFILPQSMTNTTSSIVTEVSAMLVDITIFRTPSFCFLQYAIVRTHSLLLVLMTHEAPQVFLFCFFFLTTLKKIPEWGHDQGHKRLFGHFSTSPQDAKRKKGTKTIRSSHMIKRF